MNLVEIDVNNLTNEEYLNLRRICPWINRNPNSILYALKVEEDIKVVAILKDFGQVISTEKELSLGTKKEERNKGYATTCVSMILEDIKRKPEVYLVHLIPLNPLTSKIIKKTPGLKAEGSGFYFAINENFNPKYEAICDLIKNEYSTKEELINSCNDDEYMKSIVEKLYTTHEQTEIPEVTINRQLDQIINRGK